jgi:hypothetical protein
MSDISGKTTRVGEFKIYLTPGENRLGVHRKMQVPYSFHLEAESPYISIHSKP